MSDDIGTINIDELELGDTIFAAHDHNGYLDSYVVAIDREARTITIEHDGDEHTLTVEEMLEHGDRDTPGPERRAHDAARRFANRMREV